MTSPVKAWSIQDVQGFLEGLGLSSLSPEFEKNAVNGADLLRLSDNDFTHELKCTGLQLRKIKEALQKLAPGAVPSPSPQVQIPQVSIGTPAPPLPTNSTGPRFTDDQVTQYKALRSKIAELEGQQVEAAASAAQQRVQQGTAQRAALQEKIRFAKADQTKAQKKLDGMGAGCSLGTLFTSKKKQEVKRLKLEKSLQSSETTIQTAEKDIATTDAQIAASQGEAAALLTKVQELGSTRASLKALVDQIFAGAGWASDPQLSALRASIQDLNAKAAEAQTHAGTYNRGRDILTSAHTKIAQAQGLLARSRVVSIIGMGRAMGPRRRPAGSLMLNMGQMMAIRQANDLVRSAAEDFASARQILPALPFQNEAVMNSARMGVFVSVLAPGFMGNMAGAMMIRRSMETVSAMQAGVQQSLEWTKRNLDAFALEVRQLGAAAAGKQTEIVAYQRAQLDAAAGI